MDYEKLYKDALENARQEYNTTENVERKRWLEELFPELKESEDERFIKALKEGFKYHKLFNPTFGGISCIEIENWLDKKGEQKPINYTDEDIVEAVKNASILDMIGPKFKAGNWVVNNNSGDVYLVTEIRDDEYCLWPLDGEIMGYLRIIDVDNDYHLWNIQNAKDGDVLVDSYSKDSIIILYKGIYKERSILAHCGWNGYNLSIKTNGLGYGGLNNTNYSPATKEQRDLLFQKMKEKGYEWDAEKKELKKIHVIDEGKAEMDYCFTKMMNGEKVSSVWGEEDDTMLMSIIATCKLAEQDRDSSPARHLLEMQTNWLKSLKERIEG